MDLIQTFSLPASLDKDRHNDVVMRVNGEAVNSIDLTRTQGVRLKQSLLLWAIDNDTFTSVAEPHLAHKVSISGNQITLHFPSTPKAGRNILFWPQITNEGDRYTVSARSTVHRDLQIADASIPSHALGDAKAGETPHTLVAVFEGKGSYLPTLQDAMLRTNLGNALSKAPQAKVSPGRPKPSFLNRMKTALGF